MSEIAESVFWESHEGLPDQGPCDLACTERALAMLGELPARPRILDVGCGPGRTALYLARKTGGTVLAVDLHVPFLDALERRAREEGLAEQIRTVQASMFDMPLEDHTFDLLWCEGAIYIRGFDEGLRDWKRFLVPGGAVAVTDCAWLCDDPPQEARDFWDEDYPRMRSVEGNLQAARELGYTVLGCFPMPPEAWDAYFAPLMRRLPALEAKHAGNEEALAVLNEIRRETQVYAAHGDSYGYAFYVLRA